MEAMKRKEKIMPHRKPHKLKSGKMPPEIPTVVYPKEKMEAIERIIKEHEENGLNSKTFSSVEEMFKDMGIDIEDL